MLLVIVDYQNLFEACKDKIPLEHVFDQIQAWAAERGGLAELRLFIPVYQDITLWRIMRNLQLRYGLSIEVCPVLREREEEAFSRKDLVDLSVYQWLTKHVHCGLGPDTIAFVTGDGDFILAANEAKRRGKETEFWGVAGGENVSSAIRRNFTYREIKIQEETFLSSEDNPFTAALSAAVGGQPLDEGLQEKMRVLKGVVNGILPALGDADATLERKIETLARRIQDCLDMAIEDARNIVRTLLVAGVIKITPVTTQFCSVDELSTLYQWMSSTDAL